VTFTLAGTVQGSTVRWSARVSLSDGQQTLDDFELYTAETDLSSRTGSWQLFYRIDGERRNVLNADFSVPGEAETTITYSVPQSADQHAGDSVQYERSGDDYVFDWQQVAQALNHLVTWNAVTNEGSITATNYNNGQQSCWDSELNNADC